jgi:hypothetical protein
MDPDSWGTGILAISALPTNMQNCLQIANNMGQTNYRQWKWKVYLKVTESQKIHSQGQMQPLPH